VASLVLSLLTQKASAPQRRVTAVHEQSTTENGVMLRLSSEPGH